MILQRLSQTHLLLCQIFSLMKSILRTISIVFLVINTVAGLVLSSYNAFNWISSDIAILIGLVFRLILNSSNASDGMKISFNFILTFFTITSFLLAVLMPPVIKDNLIFIFLMISISIQILIAIIPKYLTSISNSNQ